MPQLDRHGYFYDRVGGLIVPDPLKNRIGRDSFDLSDVTRYTVTEDDMRDVTQISLKVYGTLKLWWFILMANDIIDPFMGLELGQTLVIPSSSQVFSLLGQLVTANTDDAR